MAVRITWGMCALPLSWQTLRRSRQALAARDECPFEIAILKPSHVWKSQKGLCLQITWHSVSEASDSKRIHFTLTQHAPCLHQLHWQTHRYLRTHAHRSHWQDHVIFNPSYYAFGHFSRQGGSGICFSECHVPVSGAARERNESSKQSSTQVSTLTRIAPQRLLVRLLVHALSTIKYMKVVVSSINLSIPSWGCSFWASNRRPWAAALAAMAAAITLCLVVATVSAAAQFLPPGTTDVPIQRPRWADEQRRFWNVWTGLHVHLANIHLSYNIIMI